MRVLAGWSNRITGLTVDLPDLPEEPLVRQAPVRIILSPVPRTEGDRHEQQDHEPRLWRRQDVRPDLLSLQP